MKRRQTLFHLLALAGIAALPARAQDKGGIKPLSKPPAEWKKLLPGDRFHVLFEEGTEAPGTSALNGEKRAGTFVCAACNLPLFDSAKKYESGTGWPSYTQSIAGHTAIKSDYKLIEKRTEYHCVRCGGHQGHIFDDGPQPRGERWCNNGVALNFIVKGQPLPALRI